MSEHLFTKENICLVLWSLPKSEKVNEFPQIWNVIKLSYQGQIQP